MDNQTATEAVHAGHAAARILDDEALQAAVARVEAVYTQVMRQERDQDARNAAYHRWNALQDVLLDLRGVMEKGYAITEAQKDEDKSKRLSRVFAGLR